MILEYKAHDRETDGKWKSSRTDLDDDVSDVDDIVYMTSFSALDLVAISNKRMGRGREQAGKWRRWGVGSAEKEMLSERRTAITR